MGSDRVRAEGKKSSSLIPGYKPKQFSFLQPRYQDQVETDSVQGDKPQNTSEQANPTPALSHSFGRMSVRPIQAKLTIGQPNDKYEQEADRVASQVVQQINVPSSAQSIQGHSVQRMEEPEEEEEVQRKLGITAIQRMEEPEEEELQTKPIISSIQRSLLSPMVQRMDLPEEEEEIQRKPMISPIQRSLFSSVVQRMKEPEDEDLQTKSTLKRSEAIAGGEASADLTSAINSARGGGQPLDTDLQQSMGQTMGADFRGVRVHTDTQADHLNQSIQAKAFTTGQDVFFRQGAYQPGSRGGQELIAHELTHVVQQKGGAVQRMKVRGADKSSEVSSKTSTKHVVDLASQATTAQANYGDSTFVISEDVLTNAVDANNYDFTEANGVKSDRQDIQANVVIYQYNKTGDPPGGLAKNQPVTLAINGVSTLCEIGVIKGGDDKLKITHFKKV